MMKTILITNDPGIATDAEAVGVTRIMVDLELMGKAERQKGKNTFITVHTKEDIACGSLNQWQSRPVCLLRRASVGSGCGQRARCLSTCAARLRSDAKMRSFSSSSDFS